MTSYWGPLGWATLHSASLLYSDEPTKSEKDLMERFLQAFKATITCANCKHHFTDFYTQYKTTTPSYLDSRNNFALFVMIAHNSVNRRLDKPVLQTADICLETLKKMEPYSSFITLRQAYMNYLQRIWSKDISSDGFMSRKSIQELVKINNEYLNVRTLNWSPIEGSVIQTQFSNPPAKLRRGIGGFKNGKLVF